MVRIVTSLPYGLCTHITAVLVVKKVIRFYKNGQVLAGSTPMGPIENTDDTGWDLIGREDGEDTSVMGVCWQGDTTAKPQTDEEEDSREKGGRGGKHVDSRTGGGVNHLLRCESARKARQEGGTV